jgi:hypothetical protein
MLKLQFCSEQKTTGVTTLPYHEKVHAVVQLQRLAVPVLKNRDPRARVWQIDKTTEMNR